MTIPAKGIPAKAIPVRKREAAPAPVVEEVVEVVEAVEETPAPKKATKKKLFSKE